MGLNFRVICATRVSAEDFHSGTALGRTLTAYNYPFVQLRLFAENQTGLPALYNQALREAVADPAILIFAHDDILICDFYWPMHILDGLANFDILGVVGNRNRTAKQGGWSFIDEKFSMDCSENLSGIVGHGTGFPPKMMNSFGSPSQEVKLLDGLMVAARSETLVANNLWFDERFDFHFYDMDLCRQAELANVRMGTSTVSVIHESVGTFGSPSWRAGYAKYLEKWKS